VVITSTKEFSISKGSLFRLLFVSYMVRRKIVIALFAVLFIVSFWYSEGISGMQYILLGWLLLYVLFFTGYFFVYIYQNRKSGIFDKIRIDFLENDLIVHTKNSPEQIVSYKNIIRSKELLGYELLYLSSNSFIAIPKNSFNSPEVFSEIKKNFG
jgi:hypothetical protein